MLLSIKSIQKSVVQLILESVLAYVDDDTEGAQSGSMKGRKAVQWRDTVYEAVSCMRVIAVAAGSV